MVRPARRVALNPVRLSRTDNRIAKNATVGTVRARHLWPLIGKSGRRKPFCKWCGAEPGVPAPCTELQQADRQARIAETRGRWEQEKLARAKAAQAAARQVERAAELARHEAKK